MVYSHYTHGSQCKQWMTNCHMDKCHPAPKNELCSVLWHSRPVHWLELMSKANFYLMPHPLVNPHLLPLRNSHNGERIFHKRCMSKRKGFPSEKITSLCHCGRKASIGAGTLIRQQGRLVGTLLNTNQCQNTHLP